MMKGGEPDWFVLGFAELGLSAVFGTPGVSGTLGVGTSTGVESAESAGGMESAGIVVGAGVDWTDVDATAVRSTVGVAGSSPRFVGTGSGCQLGSGAIFNGRWEARAISQPRGQALPRHPSKPFVCCSITAERPPDIGHRGFG